MVLNDVGFVVPTLGWRTDSLDTTLKSLVVAGVGAVVVVAPATRIHELSHQFGRYGIKLISDPQRGLAAAINHGIAQLPTSVRYVNWLGDDDEIVPDCLVELKHKLISSIDVGLVYAGCEYRSETGVIVFRTRARRLYPLLMRIGPQLISQPAILFKRDMFDYLGGLNEKLRFAFDLDLLLRFKAITRFGRVPKTSAFFGWHHGSLSVTDRRLATTEASSVRIAHLPSRLRTIGQLYEPVLRKLILHAGSVVSRKANQLERR